MQIGVDSQRAVENRRVFVVDDDDVVATALQFMLADEMETHVLGSVAEALDVASRTPPDLVLLGAGLLGGEAVGALRAALPTVRILIVCLDVDDDAVKQALKDGAQSTLARPLKLENVRRKVDAQLGRRAALEIPVVTR